MGQKFYVFVYGTLRQHERNHYLLEDARCLNRQAWTYGFLYDTGYDYPAMMRSDTERVYGEVYGVNTEQLSFLDVLEGYQGEGKQNHYERVMQTIYTNAGSFQAFVYVQFSNQVTDLEKVVFGDWKCHQYLVQDEFLYFAYGSCMDDERFELAGVRSQFSNVIGSGVVNNYSLTFTRKAHDGGRADLGESTGSVEGKVYQIGREALDYLFRREGVTAHIYRPAFIDVTIDGDLHHNVLTFLVIDREEETAPPAHYVTEILRGAKGFVSEVYYLKLQDDLTKKFAVRSHLASSD